ncbi:MAG: hypothetical protein V4726_19795 [Verrucomicrobiota bacterium]
MNANFPHDMNEELMTRWIDGQLSPEEQVSVNRLLAGQPLLGREKQAALHLGGLLRTHLPSTLEPPSPDFFTSRIMDEIRASSSMPVAKNVKVPAGTPSFWSWLKKPWFAPLASAAAVAVVFAALNGPHSNPSPSMETARIYAPDPNVVAKAFYSDSAEATVIDLQGLQPVPNDREIRAFDLASSEPAEPGQPQVFYAASAPDRAAVVLTSGTGQAPRLRELP